MKQYEYWVAKRSTGWVVYERDRATRQAKVIAHKDTEDAARFFIYSLKPVIIKKYSDRNLDLVARWRQKVYDRRKLARGSASSLLGAVNRLLLGLGSLEVENSPIEQLQSSIDRMKDQRRMAMCCNVLLKFARKDERIALVPKAAIQVTRIRLPELLGLRFPDAITRIAALASFGTGVRFGELFELRQAGPVVRVEKQRYPDWTLGPPKRGQVRNVPVISECRAYVAEWVALPEEEKKAFRTRKVALVMQDLAGITWHALRHSYAIYLRESGLSLDDVAQCLGDSIETVEKNYSGFVLDDVAAARLAKRL